MNELDLGGIGGIGLVKEGPYFGFGLLPPGQVAVVVVFLEAELARQFLVRRFVRVQVQPVQHGQRLLRVTMLLNDDENKMSFIRKEEVNKSGEFQLSTKKVQFHQRNGQSGNFPDGRKGKKFRQEARNLSERVKLFFFLLRQIRK
jgi:hypothetical protein